MRPDRHGIGGNSGAAKPSNEVTQMLIDDFMQATMRDTFNPADFVDYVQATGPDHPFWSYLFASGDAHAAREFRITLVRKAVSGLRTVIRPAIVYENEPMRPLPRDYIGIAGLEDPKPISGPLHTVPSMLSWRDKRGSAEGSYVRFDPTDPAHMAEFAGQAADALTQFVSRFGYALEATGCDPAAFKRTIATLRKVEGPPSGD